MGSPTLLFLGKEMKDNTGITEKIRGLAAVACEDVGLELVDVSLSGGGSRSLLRVIVDKEGGVLISDCEKTSRAIEAFLDVEDLIKGPYVLEVSSPGLDRPLLRQADFEKNVGKLARVITTDRIDDMTFFVGRITDVGEGWIRLKMEKKERPKKGMPERLSDEGRDCFIPINKISKARLEIEMK